MDDDHEPSHVPSAEQQSAFAIWLGRALRRSHDDAMHEPIPTELMKLLPPSPDAR